GSAITRASSATCFSRWRGLRGSSAARARELGATPRCGPAAGAMGMVRRTEQGAVDMQAAQDAATTLYVEELDREQFARLGPEWDALAMRSGCAAPFFSHRFLRIHLDNFEFGRRLRVLICRQVPAGGSAGRLLAAL